MEQIENITMTPTLPDLAVVTDALVRYKYADIRSRRKYVKELGGCIVKNGAWWRPPGRIQRRCGAGSQSQREAGGDRPVPQP